MSSRLRCFVDSVGGAVVGAGLGATDGADALTGLGCVVCPAAKDFSEAVTDRSSSEALFKVDEISSTFARS